MNVCRLLRFVLAATVTLLAATVMAQGAGRGQGSRAGGDSPNDPAYMLASESVQQELDLTDEQKARFQKLRDEEEQNAAAFYRGMMRLSQDQMQARFERRAKESRAKVAKILTPQQLKRLNEINVQKAGIVALGFEDVAKEVGLTAEQKKELARLGNESRQQLAELYAGLNGPPNREQQQTNQVKQKEINAKRTSQSIAVLSDQQKAKFEKLHGEPFDTSTIEPLRRKFTSQGRIDAPGVPPAAGRRPGK